MWIRSFWDVFQIMHMDNFTFCYQTSLKHYVFRARTCTHCISRRHLLCSVLLQQRNLRNSYAHFAIETEKEKTVRMKRKGDMKGQKHRESLYWVCHLVCSSTSPCYCAPIFRSQSRAGLYRAQGRVSSNHIRLHDPNTEPCENQSETSRDRCMKMARVTFTWLTGSFQRLIGYDVTWTWLADTEVLCYKEIGCVSKPCELFS